MSERHETAAPATPEGGRPRREANRRGARAATVGLALPGLLSLGVSAYTSYIYFGERLGITGWERLPLCGTGESAILALTLYSRATGRRGVAWLAYGMVLVQAIPAFALSGGPGGVVRIVLGPVILAVTLHLLLGLEAKLSGLRRDTLLGRALGEVRERLTAYLGIGRRGADSAAIARSRAADRAVTLTARLEGVKEGSRRHGRLTARLADAIDAARHGLPTEDAAVSERAIVERVIRRKSVGSLSAIPARHDWTPRPAVAAVAAVADRDMTPVPACRTPCRGCRAGRRAPCRGCSGPGVGPGPRHRDDRDRSATAVRDTTQDDRDAVSVIPMESRRQTATSRRQVVDQPESAPVVVRDDAAPVPAAVAGLSTGASVAEIVRTVMAAGVTDRDIVLTRVRQFRPDVSRSTVARAMQRHGRVADDRDIHSGQYL